VAATLAEQGAGVFARLGCRECHAAGSEAAPALAGLYGREVHLASGATVRADENYLRESLLDPEAKVVAGFDAAMSTYRGQLDEEEILALISYLKSLPTPSTADVAAPAESVMR